MITATDATSIAKQSLVQLTEESPTDLRVEEVELSSGELYWYVTLSYNTSDTEFEGGKYKKFKIETNSGRVVAMRIHRVL
ncbi:MAG: hypothetical protein IID61_10575 [SAR324 cluster bacterium]|nr:hypothetical protein [SAR324 cluster bacterium]